MATNELEAIAIVSPDAKVSTLASNGSPGPLEFPGAVVFVGGGAYAVSFDVPRRVNLDAACTTSRDGLGASIVRITR